MGQNKQSQLCNNIFFKYTKGSMQNKCFQGELTEVDM